MKLLKWLSIVLPGAAFCLVVFFYGMTFIDGPRGMVSGGPFKTGVLYQGPEPDWSFVRDRNTVEFQLLEPPRSRTTWIMEHNNRIFIPSGYMNSTMGKIWKQWPFEAEKSGQAILRIDNKLYQRNLVRRVKGDYLKEVLGEANRKYSTNVSQKNIDSGDLWVFELLP